MDPERAPVAGLTPRRPGSRLLLALLFLLAVAFSLLSSFPFAAFALVYGPNVAASIIQADASSLLWLLRSWELAFFLIFYELGKRFDFRGQYLELAALCLAGVLIGSLPELLSVQTSSTTSSVVIGFAFQGAGLGSAIALSVSFLTSVLQDFAFPFAGLALAFLREDYLRPALWPSAASGERRFLSPPTLALGVAITTSAYIASGLTDVIGSRLPMSDQFAYLRSILVVFTPYDFYASDFFYPMLFFIAFYFIGKRLDTRRGGMVAFAVSVYAAGTLGFLLGSPLAYYVRAFAATPSKPFPPFSFGLSFFADSAVRGLYVLALSFAAASLGFVRNMENPINRDRLVAVAVVAAALVMFAVSVFVVLSLG